MQLPKRKNMLRLAAFFCLSGSPPLDYLNPDTPWFIIYQNPRLKPWAEKFWVKKVQEFLSLFVWQNHYKTIISGKFFNGKCIYATRLKPWAENLLVQKKNMIMQVHFDNKIVKNRSVAARFLMVNTIAKHARKMSEII